MGMKKKKTGEINKSVCWWDIWAENERALFGCAFVCLCLSCHRLWATTTSQGGGGGGDGLL